MAFAAQRFDNSGYESKRHVIDISGDGRTNDGPPAEMVRDKLVTQGIVINGLPVMMNRTNFGRPPDAGLDDADPGDLGCGYEDEDDEFERQTAMDQKIERAVLLVALKQSIDAEQRRRRDG